MNKLKQHIDSRQALIDARKEALREVEKGFLRPLGKWHGMDVFTWYNPSLDELSSVINTFPFPVCWLATEQQIQELALLDPVGVKSMAWVAQYNNAAYTLSAEISAPIPLVTATENLEDTLMMLDKIKQKRQVLLFTCGGNEWKDRLNQFEQFIQLKR